MRPASLEERARNGEPFSQGHARKPPCLREASVLLESDTLKESDVLRTVPYGEQRSLQFSHSSEELNDRLCFVSVRRRALRRLSRKERAE